MFKTYFIIMCGGAVGTGLRVIIGGWLATAYGENFPVGTIVVNVTGCLVIGFFAGLTGPNGPWLVSPLIRQTVMLGVLGGYTTFSSFGLQTLNLAQSGQWVHAGLNVLISVLSCLAAVWLGLALASLVATK